MSNPREGFKHVNKIIGNKKHNNNFTNIPDLAYKPIGDQVEIVNKHFSLICNKYPPLVNNFEICDSNNEDNLNFITELDTYKLLKKYSKKSLGPGDLPQKNLTRVCP